VIGLRNEDKEFWKNLGEWDVIMLMETWLEQRRWRGIKEKLPNGYMWEAQWVEKRNRKGKAMGRDADGDKKVVNDGGERGNR